MQDTLERPARPSRLPSRGRLLVGGALLLGALFYLAYLAFQGSTVYYVTVDDLLADGAGPTERAVRVNGVLLEGSFVRQTGSTEASFVLLDPEGAGQMTTVYNGVVPDLFFNEHSQVVAEGRYGNDGVFHADLLIVKCPSKYASETSSA